MSSTSIVLKKNRGKILVAIAALLIALAAAVGSGAWFTSVSNNPGNVFTAGILTHTNSDADSAFMTLADMVPGDIATGSVTITNDGGVNGGLSLAQSFVDTPGGNGGNLSDALLLDIDQGATSVYSGRLNAVPASVTAGILAPGVPTTYDFTVTFEDTGAPISATTEDNAFQGSSVTVRYDWEMISQ